MARAFQGKPTAAKGLVAGALLALVLGSGPGLASTGGVTRIQQLRPGLDPQPREIIAGEYDADFTTLATTEHVPASGRDATWFRLDATHAADADDLLLIYNPYGADVAAYLPPEYRGVVQRAYDRGADRRWSRRALVFPVAAGVRAQEPMFLRIAHARGYPLRVALKSAADYEAEDLNAVRVLTWAEATVLTIGLVTLLFWLILRERVYLMFAAYMLFQALYLACVTGEAAAVPGLRALFELGPQPVWVFASLSTAASLVFMAEFAELRRYTPRMYRAMLVLATALCAQAAIAMVPWRNAATWVPQLGNALLLLADLIVLVSLLRAWQLGGRYARFVLLAWTPLLVFTSVRAIQISAGLRFPQWLEFGLPVAMALGGVVLILGLADRMLAFRRERDLALEAAERDALTGVLNRKALTSKLNRAFEVARSRGRTVSVLFLDLDHFKRINDTFGHATGDDCLKAVVENVARELRQGDALGRYGGEEFVVILPGAYRTHAVGVAERMRQHIEQRCAEINGHPVRLTVSIGVAEMPPGVSAPGALIELADAAMYEAKRRGRNRVVVHGHAQSGEHARVA